MTKEEIVKKIKSIVIKYDSGEFDIVDYEEQLTQVLTCHEQHIKGEIRDEVERYKKWTDPDVEGMKASSYKTDPVITPLIHNEALDSLLSSPLLTITKEK